MNWTSLGWMTVAAALVAAWLLVVHRLTRRGPLYLLLVVGVVLFGAGWALGTIWTRPTKLIGGTMQLAGFAAGIAGLYRLLRGGPAPVAAIAASPATTEFDEIAGGLLKRCRACQGSVLPTAEGICPRCGARRSEPGLQEARS